MAMAQAVLGGRGLHLHSCCSTTSSLRARSLRNVKLPSTAGLLSVGFPSVSLESRRYSQLVRASGASDKNEKPKVRRETKLLSTIVPFLPILATITVTKNYDSMYADSVFITTYNDWVMPEKMTKDLYMLISMVFCWGCCVFGSMNDPFYESDEYRDLGGNGTAHWMYDMEDAAEEEAREELFREALVKEIEGKVGDLRELEDADKEKELV